MCESKVGVPSNTRVFDDDVLGVLGDVIGKMRKGVLTLGEFKKSAKRENPFEGDPEPNRGFIKNWQKFYKKVFGEVFDFSDIRIPGCPGIPGKEWRLIIVAKGMTPEELFCKCREKFGAWKWTDRNLNEIVISDRTAKDGHYAIWVRARVEADEEFKNLSVNNLKAQNHKGITLEERLVLELFHFWKTRKHLDIQNITLCSGSRYSGGSVARVDWSVGGVGVDWFSPDCSDDDLRSREAVS